MAFVGILKISPMFMFGVYRNLVCRVFKRFGKRHSAIISRNLDIAFKELTPAEAGRLKDLIYKHFSAIFLENFYLFVKKNPEKILKEIEVNNLEILNQALKKKKGVIIFSAHFGNWELIPYILDRRLDNKVYSIAREMDNPLVESVVKRFREYMGSNIIYKKGAMRSILKLLGENNIVFLLTDQNTVPREGVFVDFFTQKVSAVTSVSQLHLKKGIPVVPVFLHYSQNRIVMDLYPEVEFSKSEDYGQDILDLTQKCTAMIEEQIRKYPEQWFWFHNRWKTRPENQEGGIANEA
jgi:KDO2-lipid IV(A) lauroyltransferase